MNGRKLENQKGMSYSSFYVNYKKSQEITENMLKTNNKDGTLFID